MKYPAETFVFGIPLLGSILLISSLSFVAPSTEPRMPTDQIDYEFFRYVHVDYWEILLGSHFCQMMIPLDQSTMSLPRKTGYDRSTSELHWTNETKTAQRSLRSILQWDTLPSLLSIQSIWHKLGKHVLGTRLVSWFNSLERWAIDNDGEGNHWMHTELPL